MDDEKDIKLNRPQAELHAVNANKTYVLWGRATGKSNGGIGPRGIHLFDKMPRSQIGIVVPTYVMGEKNILPNMIGFWQNQMGLVEGENYVIGRRPPDDWPKPFLPLFDFKYVISFDTGNVMPILSLAVEGSANGLNLQAIMGDEAKFFNERKLKEIKRALRGCHKEYGHLAEFQSEWYFSDKYGGDIEWMLKKRSLMNEKLIKSVIAMQIHIDHLMDEHEATNDQKILAQIVSKSKLLDKVRQNLVFVSEASAEENREILGDKFFEDQKADSTEIQYKVAIANEDPDEIENSFYPGLNSIHFYNEPYDVDPAKPLIIACDYQWRISPVATAQYGILPKQTELSLNLTYSCHTEAPEGLIEAIDKWANHHKGHVHKLVYYTFDKTAVGRTPTGKPYYESVMERLRYNGWKVVPINMGEPPRHEDKFKTISKHLQGSLGKPPIRINALRNQDMIISIKKSPAITYNGKTRKDKTSEKNTSIPAKKSTHYSDTFDMILHVCLEMDLIPRGSSHFVGSSFT